VRRSNVRERRKVGMAACLSGWNNVIVLPD
jgi:hypothetical protein